MERLKAIEAIDFFPIIQQFQPSFYIAFGRHQLESRFGVVLGEGDGRQFVKKSVQTHSPLFGELFQPFMFGIRDF